MPQTPGIERAAQLIAERVRTMVIAMLVAGETGEVAVLVDFYGLKPVKRVETEGKTVRVERGYAEIESVIKARP